jgi:hypothetical protein
VEDKAIPELDALLEPERPAGATVVADRDVLTARAKRLIAFAAGFVAFAACYNLVASFALIARSNSFGATPQYLFGNLRTWGFFTLLIAIAQFGAAWGILTGSQRARWVGVGLLLLNAIGQIVGLPEYPFWFLVVTAVGMVVLCGLAISGERRAG